MANSPTFGEKAADAITQGMGTWAFIIGQAVFTGAWLILNTIHGWSAWDHYPYVLLNLVYSFQAGFTGPILLLSQNRQVARDSANLTKDLETDTDSLELLRQIADKLEVTIKVEV
jgi:uncharacterized membrane protein